MKKLKFDLKKLNFFKKKKFIFTFLFLCVFLVTLVSGGIAIYISTYRWGSLYTKFKEHAIDKKESFVGILGSENCEYCNKVDKYFHNLVSEDKQEDVENKNLIGGNNSFIDKKQYIFSPKDEINDIRLRFFEKDYFYDKKKTWQDSFWDNRDVIEIYRLLYINKTSAHKISKGIEDLEWDSENKKPIKKIVPIIFFYRKGQLVAYTLDSELESASSSDDDKGKGSDSFIKWKEKFKKIILRYMLF